jgi:hypothetical protein
MSSEFFGLIASALNSTWLPVRALSDQDKPTNVPSSYDTTHSLRLLHEAKHIGTLS